MFFINIYFYDFFSLSVDSQDIQVVSSAFVTSYTREYTGTFGQPAPNARYHVHTVLFGKRKTCEKILRVKIRAQVRKEVFVTGVEREITETFNSFNATLLHSQAEFLFLFFVAVVVVAFLFFSF